MLKSFEYIKLLNKILLDLEGVNDFHIKLTVNQQLDVFIVSSSLSSVEMLQELLSQKGESYNINLFNSSVKFSFYSEEEAEENYYYFENEKIDYGLRRSLENLINNDNEKTLENSKVITFFSHKGGVGRTTSLALLARYYSEKGKKVFIIDCDFEAPGLLNFFSISQFNTPKSGVVEYLNDKRFDRSTKLDDKYVYEVSNRYVGEGSIHLLPAGNIFGGDKEYYLEGLARLDLFSSSMFLNDMSGLIVNIQENYSPNVILIDSRTGFNNVFGSLSKISNHVVGLFGDDIQNRPGLDFILDKYSDRSLHSKLTIVTSIISTNIRKRHLAMSEYVSESVSDLRVIIPTFVFPRESALELIGTSEESEEDFKYFSSEGSPTSYSPFFSHMEKILNDIGLNDEQLGYGLDFKNEILGSNSNNLLLKIQNSSLEESTTNHLNYADEIIENLYDNFPELYADNIVFSDDLLKDSFYLRKCMQDIFLPEFKFLIGGKGTGKTYFYKALQDRSFVDALLTRAEKNTKDFNVINIISDISSTKGFISLTAYFNDEYLDDESFVRKFWIIYIWSEISNQTDLNVKGSCDLIIKNDILTATKIIDIIGDDSRYLKVEIELSEIDRKLKSRDEKLVATFDQLDIVVKPVKWDKGISPLIRICQSNSWERIQPKLFLRRDLFEKLGNITNKQSLSNQAIDLEWSCDEMYAFLFKVIYSNSRKAFTEFLNINFSAEFANNSILKRILRKNSFNQLPDDGNLLRPLVNSFFGDPRLDYVDAYEALYRNIRNANQTISLRPFLDMIKFAIEAQQKDNAAKRQNAVLGIDYCFFRSVRQKAVENYFLDMAQEEGNDVIKYFIEDIQNNKVPEYLKCSSLMQRDFEKLVQLVKENHPDLKSVPTTTFEEMLVLNGIIFVTVIPGGYKKFSFAYLYKFYLNLSSPRRKKATQK